MKKLLLALLCSAAIMASAQTNNLKKQTNFPEYDVILQLLDRPVTTTVIGQDVFLQKNLTDYLNYTIAPGSEDGGSLLRAYFMKPHPSNATIKKYFREASAEFGVPVALLEVIGQVENNWTQTGPTIDQGWGIMHLVKNNYCQTLTEASVLLGIPEQTLKDDARQNIRGAAALIAKYALSQKGRMTGIEDWFPAVAQFSGLINEELRNKQASTYFRTLKNGVQAPTVWGEQIVIAPYTGISDEVIKAGEKKQTKGAKSTDYGPALTNMAPSCNYTSGRTTSVDTWVMHWVGTGTYAGAISWFLNCSSSVSNHFVIRSSDGEITQCVSVSNTAWHCGATGYPLNNPRSIGCEHEATSANPSLWNSTPMLQASATMVCYFKNIYNFPTTQNTCPGICGHNGMPGTSTACPGSLPWSTWYGYFNSACAPAGTCVTCPTYDFSITPSTSWQTNSSSIGSNGCKIYRVSVTSGRDYTFQTGCGNGGTATFDTYLTLYNSSCSTVASDDDGCSSPSNTSTITWTATYTGYAYLKVSGYGTNSGNFTLAYSYVAPVICNTCPTYDFSISPNTGWQTHTSSIASGGCKMYRVSVTSGNNYTFKTGCGDGATADFDTYLTLYDNGCSTLLTDDDGCSTPSNTSTISWTATYSGYAYIKVSGFGSNSGNYTLAYNYAVPVICNTCPTYDFSISPGTSWQTSSSSIVASGCKMYRVSVTSGYIYTFKTGCGDGATADFDTYLTLMDNGCSTLLTNDDGCSNPSNTSTITWTATYSGYVYVKVSGFSGNYGNFTLAYQYSICTASTDPSSASASPAAICAGGSTNLSVNGGSLGTGASWIWYAGGCGGTSAGSGSSIIVSPGSPTTYYVRAEGNCGTSNCASVSITVNQPVTPSVTVNASPAPPVCSGTDITFTPTPVNGGTPSYTWYVNGSYAGSNNTFSSTNLTDGSQIYCVMLSNASCATPATATSNTVVVNISAAIVPSVSITANPVPPVCSGSNVTFTPSPVNGGTPSYIWYVNGSYAGSGTTFSSSFLNNGAQINCLMMSNAACASPVTATSNTITLTMNPSVTAGVSIVSNPVSPVCSGTDVTFTPTPVNGGTPSYSWYVNGSFAGSGTTFSSAYLANNSQVSCVMISNGTCANPATATSNTITMTVVPSVTPWVSIAANPLPPVCAGTNITFTPVPVNGGTPSYTWFVNGNYAGSGGSFSSAYLPDGAQLFCLMTSNATCANPITATSNTVSVTVNALPAVPTVTQNGDTLISSAQSGNQWLDGSQNMIPGENGIEFIPPQDGNYYVTVTDINGCSSTSLPFAFVHVGITESGGEVNGIQIYPNPLRGSNELMISGITGETVISVFNTGGQLVCRSTLMNDGIFRLPELAQSVYVIRILSDSGTSAVKLVVE